MTKRTVWFLILFLGTSFSLLVVSSGGVMPGGKLLAQVGLVVGVAPNPYNTLNDQLQQQQAQLNQQAADLAAREAAFASSTNAAETASSPTTWYLMIAVIVIGFLVCLNFYLDYRRSKGLPVSEVPPRV